MSFFKNLIAIIKESYYINMMKNKGFSMFELAGHDGDVRTYYKKIEDDKEFKVKKGTYVINPKKRLSKNGFPLYRFNTSSFGECSNCQKSNVTNIDADTLTEIISKTRLAGQNTAGSFKGMIIYVVLGVAVGFMISYIIGAFI